MLWSLNSKPYAVQMKALEKVSQDRGFPMVKTKNLQVRRGFGYFMEMGLGKTQTALSEAVTLLAEGVIDAMVVVCPNTLKGVWAAEAAKVGAPFRVVVWDGREVELQRGDLVLINYEAVRQRGGEWLTGWARRLRFYLALDESIAIKDNRSEQTKACLLLGARSVIKRILSGAPMTQGPQDLWAQLVFLGAQVGSFWGFKMTYCRMGGWQMKKVLGIREGAEEAFAKLLDDWGFRATKDEWTDIPALIPMQRPVVMTIEQRKVYNSLVDEMFAEIDGGTVQPEIVLTRILRLQQVSSGFVTLDDGTIARLVKPKANPKVQTVLDIMADTAGKAIVFTMFRESVTVLSEALADYNPAFIVGGQSDVDEQKARFEQDPECRVIIVQQQAGKYGHTLLGGGSCATTIFYEMSWSLDTRLQALARNHRHGQTKSVVVHDLPASPIDEAVIHALSHKESSAEALVNRFKALRQEKLL